VAGRARLSPSGGVALPTIVTARKTCVEQDCGFRAADPVVSASDTENPLRERLR
jgi:hypothetical protein